MKKRVIAIILVLCISAIDTMGVLATSPENADVGTVTEAEQEDEPLAEQIADEGKEQDLETEQTADEGGEQDLETGDVQKEDVLEEALEQQSDLEESINIEDVPDDKEDIIAQEQSETDKKDSIEEKSTEHNGGKMDDSSSLTENEVAVSNETELIELERNAKDIESGIGISDVNNETELLKASREQSAEDNMDSLIHAIMSNGSKVDAGWKISDADIIDSATISYSILVNLNKGFVRFQCIVSNESSGLKSCNMSMDYDLIKKEYKGVDVLATMTSSLYFLADAEIDPETYYPNQELSFKKLMGNVSDDNVYAFSNSYKNVAFAAWAKLLSSKEDMFFPWIGFPKYCFHTWNEEYTVDKQPTYIEEGSESIHCVICNEIQEGSERPIEKLIKTGWSDEEIGRVYRDEEGNLVKGWQTIDGEKYYFDNDGAMHISWLQLGDKWYYFRTNGVMHTGTLKKDGKYYYFRKDGTRLSGWLKVSGKTYYHKLNGERLFGWLKVNGNMFYFKTNGEMLTGWLKKNGKMYYFKTSGQMLKGWLKLKGKYYYFKTNGQMVTGRYKIGNKWYTFNKNGVRQ